MERRSKISIFCILFFTIFVCIFADEQSRGGIEEKLEFTIEEGVPAGTVIGTVRKRQSYVYRLNERNAFFNFDPATGEIRTLAETGAGVLDREALERHGYKNDKVEMVVSGSATAAGLYPSTYFVTVTIHVSDVNDNAPVFPFAFQNVSLPESARVGTRVVLASATDLDTGDNGLIVDYKLINGNEDGVFNLIKKRNTIADPNGSKNDLSESDNPIDSSSAAVLLELQKPLDRETRTLYILNVSAVDGGRPTSLSGYTTVFVNVLDTNDNAPIFDRLQYSISVSENLPAGSSICLVSATDKDNGENARISYSIGNDAQQQFRINSDTGIIYSNTAPLECPETKIANVSNNNVNASVRLCTFTVEAVDYGVPAQRGRAFVNVELFDVNDHSPDIKFRFYSPVGDGGKNDDSAAIIDETKPVGTVVAVVTVTDPDHGDNGRTNVRIETGNDDGHFRLESNDLFSVIRTNAALKRSVRDRYNLTITAADNGQPRKFSRRHMLIYVNDASDRAPVFEKSTYFVEIKEHAPRGSFAGAVRAHLNTDDLTQTPNKIFYDFQQGNDSSNFFALNQNTGLITVNEDIDFDYPASRKNFTLTVRAKDAARPTLRSSTTVVKIKILDTNDNAPVFSKRIYEAMVPENAPVGTVILQLAAKDADTADNGRVNFAFDTPGNGIPTMLFDRFALDSLNGTLTLAQPLDREKMGEYRFDVVAFDYGIPPQLTTAAVKIVVIDINDNAPTFTFPDYYVNLHPYDPPGTVLARISATDDDEGVNGEIKYFFLEQPPVNAISLNQKTGEVYLKMKLLTNVNGRFDLVFGAEDGSGLRSSNNATVHVFFDADSTGGAPQFSKNLYVFTVPEDPAEKANIGKSIGTVSATDSDQVLKRNTQISSSLRYKIIAGDPKNIFTIGQYSGEIRSTRAIDYEENANFTLVVAAMGKYGVSRVDARVNILDINDNAPRFENLPKSKINIDRSAPVGSRFFYAKAVDADSGPNGMIRYYLKKGQTQEFFAADERTGTLFLKTPAYALVKDNYILTLVAEDSGSPPLSSEAIFNISVVDESISYNYFPEATFDFGVYENTPVNTLLIKLNLTYAVDTAVFTSDDSIPEDAIGVFPDGWLYVKNDLDYEMLNIFKFTVRAMQKVPGDSGTTSSTVEVTVRILDVNDNAPRCQNETFEFRVPEHASPLTYVGTVRAEDADDGLNGRVNYRFLTENDDFLLDSSTGVLTALKPFDRNFVRNTYGASTVHLTFYAEDNGQPTSRRTQCKIQVHISDVNDHAPQFALDVYTAAVPENRAVGTEIFRFSAVDEDQSGTENAKFEFSILEGDPENQFWLNASTGQLLLRKNLDRERRDAYELKIMAEDFGRPRLNSTAFASIFVVDVNDNAPQFLHFPRILNLSESTVLGTVLAKIEASDADLGASGTIRYILAKGNTGETFELDPNDGVLRLVKRLDYETQRNFTLKIDVADRGTPALQTSAEIFVNVLDENDNAPIFTTSIFVERISRNAPAGTRIFAISATDADDGPNGEIRYRLLDQKPPAPTFRVDENSGEIFLNGFFDPKNTPDAYNLLAEASDFCADERSRLSTRKFVTILITESTDDYRNYFAPPFIFVLSPENAQQEFRLANVLDNENVTFRLTDPSTLFSITSDGLLRLRKRPDFTKSTFLNLRVEAATFSGEKFHTDYAFIFSPFTSDENFKFGSSRYEFSANADASNGTEIGRINLKNPKNGAQFYLKKSNFDDRNSTNKEKNTDTFFDVDKNSGVLYATGLLRRGSNAFGQRKPDAVYLQILAVDATTQKITLAECEVIVKISPSNSSRSRFSENFYQFQAYENVEIDTKIGVAQAFQDGLIDGEARKFTYSLVDNGGNVPFSVDPRTGIIKNTAILDREINEFYEFQIRADMGGESIFASVRIDILDVNDNAPEFRFFDSGRMEKSTEKIFRFNIAEGAQKNAFVGKVNAIDKDAGANGEISYKIASREVAQYFDIDESTGIVRVNGVLDREEYSIIYFEVEASDHGNPSKTARATVFVDIIDINDNQPVMEKSFHEISVFENVTIGSELLQLKATDLDTDTVFSYAIVSGNAWSLFAIDHNGSLSVAGPLDREKRAIHHLVVAVYDQPSNVAVRFSANAQVTINLLDVNDCAPTFTSSSWSTVRKTAPVGTTVTVIKAVDPDEAENGDVSYLLDPMHSEFFTVDPISGDMRTKKLLINSTSTVHNVTIWAYDHGEPFIASSFQFQIFIFDDGDRDDLDRRPIFAKRVYEISVIEDAPVGSSLVQLEILENARNDGLTYFISSTNEEDVLSDLAVAPDSAILSTSANLDFERRTTYNFTVAAYHSATKKVVLDEATVLVHVKDANDNAPVFRQTPVYFRVVEGLYKTPVVIGLATAVDADTGVNGKLSYSIIQGNTSVFSIDSLNGELRMQGDVDRETLDRYTLVIEAADSGSPRLTASTDVIVNVLDINDNEPVFVEQAYEAKILENQVANTLVVQVSATDEDLGENGIVKYVLQDADRLPFTIDSSTGRIFTKTSLDRESRDSYELTVFAMDSAVGDVKRSIVSVRIDVEDVNDNAPAIIDTAQDIYIKNSISNGDFVYIVGATDADYGENSRLRYTLSGRDANFFIINSTSGVITARNVLKTANDYSVDVFISDSGTPPQNVSTSYRFFPRATSEFPIFHASFFNSNRTFIIDENQTDTEIVIFSARSPKTVPLNRVTYAVTAGDFDHAFDLDPYTGRLKTTQNLDYEKRHLYELFVGATDNDNPPLTSFASVIIEIRDCNDNAPVFEKAIYKATVVEEEQPPQVIVKVKATDADSGSNGVVKYALREHEKSLFAVDENTGVVRTLAPLDREKSGQYRFFIEATDRGHPKPLSSKVLCVVDILDINDNAPKFTRLFAATVREDAAVGDFVVKVTSSDADILPENVNNTYYFSVNPGEKFALDPYSGNVTVNSPLDRESNSEYQLKVVAVDGAWRVETSLTVTVLDVNDNAPSFSQRMYSFNVLDTLPPLSVIGQVQAADADEKGPNSKVNYRLLEKSSLFFIDSQNGQLRTARNLKDHHQDFQSTVHQLTVVASDGGRPVQTSIAEVFVRITSSSAETPTFKRRSQTVAMPAEVAANVNIAKVQAESNDTVVYSLDMASDIFVLDSKTGWLSTAKSLQNSVGAQYKLSISARDSNAPSSADSIELTLLACEPNKNAPEFSSSSYSVTVPENATPGMAIFTVSARDYDQGLNGKLSYQLWHNGTTENQALFSIDEETGVIFLKGILDYEKEKLHSLFVSASDSGYLPKNTTAILTILVQDVNDNAPVFNFENEDHFIKAHVFENSPKGTKVFQLNCTDSDSPPFNAIVYSIENSNSKDEIPFLVDSESGLISVAGNLDYETKAVYELRAKCTNPSTSNQLFSSTTLKIYVEGVNEYFPKFEKSNYEFSADVDSVSIGSILGRVRAADEDGGADGAVFYSSKVQNEKIFSVDRLSGEIILHRQIESNRGNSTFLMTVFAHNRLYGSPAEIAAVDVEILFTKNRPIFTFSKDIFEAKIYENATSGTDVLRVESALKRSGVIFSLTSGNFGNAFSIETTSGIIRANGNLDREKMDSYELTISAFDTRNSTIILASTMAKIRLLDVNDNAPYLKYAAAVGRILEGDPIGTTVMILSPTDDDLPPNQGPFRFAFADAKWANLFDLNSTTGVLKNKVVFDREKSPRFYVPVVISDGGIPVRTAVVNVTIIVEDVNDWPSKNTLTVVKVLNYDGPVDTGVILAIITPDDQDSIGNYQCRLRSSNSSLHPFVLDSNCSIITPYDAHFEAANFRLSLTASDGVHDFVDFDTSLEFEKFDEGLLNDSVVLHIRGAYGRLAKTFSDRLNAMLKPRGKYAKIMYVSAKKSVLQENYEMTVVIFSENNAPTPFFNAISLLGDIAPYFSDNGDFEIVHVFDGFCKMENLCKNGGLCSERVWKNGNVYNFIKEDSKTFAFPEIRRSYKCDCPTNFRGDHCETIFDRCSANPCSVNATCIFDEAKEKITCICPPGFSGSGCDVDVDECAAVQEKPCLNNGWCENTRGAYRCICMVGYSGPKCEFSNNLCSSQPCKNGGICKETGGEYSCACKFGYGGRDCSESSMGFDTSSYMEISSAIWKAGNSAVNALNTLVVEFATIRSNGLILFSGENEKTFGDFFALEIAEGVLRLAGVLNSVDGRRVPVKAILKSKKFNDGQWHRVTVFQNGTIVGIVADNCVSEKCDPLETSVHRATIDTKSTKPLKMPGEQIYIGSVREFNHVLHRANQLAAPGFFGCMRKIEINGVPLEKLPVTNQNNVMDACPRIDENPCSRRSNLSCAENEQCLDAWTHAVCQCQDGFSATSCRKADKAITFGGKGGYVSYEYTEAYRRRLFYLAAAANTSEPNDFYRFKKRSMYPKQWLVLEFRTWATDALLFFAMSANGDFSLIDIVNGSVRYISRTSQSTPIQVLLTDGPFVSDGEWHMVSLAIQGSGNEVEFRIDNFGKDARTGSYLHAFSSANLTFMSIGGTREPIKIGASTLKSFTGCARKFILNGMLQPLSANDYSSVFRTKMVGDGINDGCSFSGSDCLSPPCTPVSKKPLNAGVVAVLVFFSCLIVSTVSAYFIVKRWRRRKYEKATSLNSDRSAPPLNAAANISTLRDLVLLSRTVNEGGSVKDSGIALGVSRQTLDGSQISLNNPLDAHRVSPLSVSTYLNNYIRQGVSREDLIAATSETSRMPERYDLDNASSIAPSDTDVARHYRGFRDAMEQATCRDKPLKFARTSKMSPERPTSTSRFSECNRSRDSRMSVATVSGAANLRNCNTTSGQTLLRATPASVLTMMPVESESSDEVMMQQNVGSDTQTPRSRPNSSRNTRRSKRRPAQQSTMERNRNSQDALTSSTRSKNRRSSKKRRQSAPNYLENKAHQNNSSSTDIDSLTDATTAALPTADFRTTLPGWRPPRILSHSPHENHHIRKRTSSSESASENGSVLCSEFDLDKVRKPRRFLQEIETETESDAPHAKFDQFLAGPRALFLMSEDDNATDVDENRKRAKFNLSSDNRASRQQNYKEGLEAYV